jgi:hypothetical protein
LFEVSRIIKFIKTKGESWLPRAGGKEGMERYLSNFVLTIRENEKISGKGQW